MKSSRATNGFHRSLTLMQCQVVRLCALGCTARQIAHLLDLSPSTIDNHKGRAMAKVCATNLAMLTRYAIETGISPIGDALTDDELAKLEAMVNLAD